MKLGGTQIKEITNTHNKKTHTLTGHKEETNNHHKTAMTLTTPWHTQHGQTMTAAEQVVKHLRIVEISS